MDLDTHTAPDTTEPNTAFQRAPAQVFRPASKNGLISKPAQPRNSNGLIKTQEKHADLAQQAKEKGKEIYAIDSDSDEDVPPSKAAVPPVICAPQQMSPVVAAVQETQLPNGSGHSDQGLQNGHVDNAMQVDPVWSLSQLCTRTDPDQVQDQPVLSPLSPPAQERLPTPEFEIPSHPPLVTVPSSIPDEIRARSPVVPRLVLPSPPKASTSKQTLDDPVRSAINCLWAYFDVAVAYSLHLRYRESS